MTNNYMIKGAIKKTAIISSSWWSVRRGLKSENNFQILQTHAHLLLFLLHHIQGKSFPTHFEEKTFHLCCLAPRWTRRKITNKIRYINWWNYAFKKSIPDWHPCITSLTNGKLLSNWKELQGWGRGWISVSFNERSRADCGRSDVDLLRFFF